MIHRTKGEMRKSEKGERKIIEEGLNEPENDEKEKKRLKQVEGKLWVKEWESFEHEAFLQHQPNLLINNWCTVHGISSLSLSLWIFSISLSLSRTHAHSHTRTRTVWQPAAHISWGKQRLLLGLLPTSHYRVEDKQDWRDSPTENISLALRTLVALALEQQHRQQHQQPIALRRKWVALLVEECLRGAHTLLAPFGSAPERARRIFCLQLYNRLLDGKKRSWVRKRPRRLGCHVIPSFAVASESGIVVAVLKIDLMQFLLFTPWARQLSGSNAPTKRQRTDRLNRTQEGLARGVKDRQRRSAHVRAGPFLIPPM